MFTISEPVHHLEQQTAEVAEWVDNAFSIVKFTHAVDHMQGLVEAAHDVKPTTIRDRFVLRRLRKRRRELLDQLQALPFNYNERHSRRQTRI